MPESAEERATAAGILDTAALLLKVAARAHVAGGRKAAAQSLSDALEWVQRYQETGQSDREDA